jgi:flagellar hook-basal body complex protein FliE
MSSMQIDAVLAQIRSMQAQVRGIGGAPKELAQAAAQSIGQAPAATPFADLLKQGLDQVNQAQQSAAHLATQFERGVAGVELPQVMLEMQKANVSFRAVSEVRNRFVNAYQEIMNMPI